MPYSYTPRSEEEVLGLLHEGTYKFRIVGSTERPSKSSGALMVVINIQIQGANQILLEEYISYQETMDWKIKHLCDSCDKTDVWKSGKFDGTNNSLVGWEGYAVIKIDKKGDRPRNRISDFVVATPQIENDLKEPLDDNIPF